MRGLVTFLVLAVAFFTLFAEDLMQPRRSTKQDPDGVFPNLRDHTLCDPVNPSERCEGRRVAQQVGEFFPDFERGYWVFADGLLRRSSFRAKYYDLNEHDDEPIRIVDCPWCGNELPSIDQIRKHHDAAAGDDQC